MKFSIIISFILVITLLVTSCKKADVQFGSEFLDNGLTQIVRIDSFTPSLSTVYLDSFITSNKGAVVIGSYNDTYFGRISSESFFEVNPPSYQNIYDQTMFDSIALIIKPNGFYYGDTTKPLHFTVSKLSELIVSKNFDVTNQYYNNQSFKTGYVIGTGTKYINPVRKDDIIIRLDNSVGLDLFTQLQNQNNTIFKTTTDFINYFNGLKVNADLGDKSIFGFSDAVTMRLYYRKGSAFPQNLTADFILSNKAHQFNHITINRSNVANSYIKNISITRNEIPSALTGNMSYNQSFSGLMTKIRLSSINDVQKLPNFAKILKAVLVIKPLEGSFNLDSYTLPPNLRLSTTNPLNQFIGDILNVGSSGSAVQTGNLYIDNLNSLGTEYTYDLTPYVKSLLNNSVAIDNGLLLSPPSPAFQNQSNRVLVGDNFNPNAKTQLVIYYAAVQ